MKQLELLYEGKSKQIFKTDSPDSVVVRFKDDTAAFYGIKRANIENKGRLTCDISSMVLGYLNDNDINTHFIERVDDDGQLCRIVEHIPVEVIVRNVVAGSMAKRLGMEEGIIPENTIFDLCLRRSDLGDPLINDHHAVALGLLSYDELAKMYEMSAKINKLIIDLYEKVGITVVDFTAAIELIKDTDGKVAGAVLMNMETKEILIARAKTVVIATGGAGRLHYQGFPTSNHYGATADGLVLAYRAGAKLLYPETLQYHPTGAAEPTQIYGALVTEKVRSLGAQLVNKDGEAFVYSLETRDVTASSIIRECKANGNGIKTTDGEGVWLDTPLIDILNGEGTIEKRIPAMLRMFGKYGIDIRKEPILIYPTLHYQNGGIDIGANGMTCIENLYVAGEAVGGIHGTNRLMGNSLLDIIVFGRNAGQQAGEKWKTVELKELTLSHVDEFEKELEEAGISSEVCSPKLLPDYRRKAN